MIEPSLTVEAQLVGWSIVLGLLLVGLAFGAWREEKRRIDEEMERREQIKGELRNGE
jgi:hypothetical protein